MTPLNLLHALKNDLERTFKGFVDLNQRNEAKQFSFYENAAPVPLDGQNESDIYPYGVVMVISGVVPENPQSAPTAKAIILLGYYDEDLSNNGNMFLLTAIDKIVERYMKSNLLDSKYSQTGDIEWSISDEDSYPYYFAGLELTFSLPKIPRESDFC